MRGFTGLLLLLPLVHATPLLADLEGSRYMSEQHSSNAVPRIGRRASSVEDLNALGSFLPQYPYPHLLRESQSWSKVGKRGNSFPDFSSKPLNGRDARSAIKFDLGRAGKRGPQSFSDYSVVNFSTQPLKGREARNAIKFDLGRVGKRGPPSFSLPDSWRSKKRSPLSTMRDHMYPQASKRSAQPKDQWTVSWAHQLGGPQGFRLHDGDLDYLTRTIMYKRAEDPVRDLNSVPFIGKRAEENKLESQDDNEMLIRVPREETNEDETNPWEYLNLASQLQDGLMM